MKKFLAVLLLVCVGSDFLVFGGTASHTQNEIIVIAEKKTVRVLYGVVLDPSGETMEGVNVDVLNSGELITKGRPKGDVEQRVIASVKTNAFGKFRFKNIPAGKYEVRFNTPNFNELHIYVEVKSSSGNLKEIKINLPVAT